MALQTKGVVDLMPRKDSPALGDGMRFHNDDFGPLKALAPFPRLKKEVEELRAWASKVEKNDMTLLKVTADEQAFADAVEDEAKRMARFRVRVSGWRHLSGLVTALQFGLAALVFWRNVLNDAGSVAEVVLLVLGGVVTLALWMQERDKADALAELEARGYTWEFERHVRDLAATVYNVHLSGISCDTPWGSEIIAKNDIRDMVVRKGNRTWSIDIVGKQGNVLKTIGGLKPSDAEAFKDKAR